MIKTRKMTLLGIALASLLLLVMHSAGYSVSAQDASTPLYYNSDGDLWRTTLSNNNTEQLSEWGYNGGPILSPDGSRVAYLSVASEAVELAADPANNYLLFGSPPTNIWMMETEDEDFSRLVDQGSNFPLRRGIPAWSPDSSQLAWVQYSESLGAQLVIHTVSTGTSRIVLPNVNLGFQDGGVYVHPVQWGPSGISRMYGTFVENGQFQSIIEFYNTANSSISQFLLASEDFTELTSLDADIATPREHVWVEHNARAMIAVLYSDNTWILLDPATGEQFALPESPFLMAANGNRTTITPVLDSASGILAWRVVPPNGTVNTIDSNGFRLLTPPALSPDGTTVATNDLGTIRYLQVDDGASTTLRTPTADLLRFSDPYSVVWTPLRWVTDTDTGTVIPTPSVPDTNTGSAACDAPQRLAVGDLATINAGLPNNVRASASIGGAYVGQLASGAFFSIADGPVCADGLRWWQIQTEGGLVGWTAEASADGEPWILPLVSSPLVNTCALDVRLQPGDTGVVLAGAPNVLRDGPDANGTNVIGQIPAGDTFTVLGTSLCGSDDRRWFPVQYGTLTGWTAQGEGNTYWIAPVD